MSLRVWLPLTGDLHNQGLDNPSLTTPSSFNFIPEGKIGSCLKTSSTEYLDLGYNGNQINTGSLSFGGWFKFNYDEINNAIKDKTYTSTYAFASGNLIGNGNYGGIGLHWTSNRIVDDGAFSTINVITCVRSTTNGARSSTTYTLPFDEWIHIFLVFDKDNKKCLLYINGIQEKSVTMLDFSDARSYNLMLNYRGLYGGNGPGCYIPFSCNDLRIYDHALSKKEIKEISKGLVLHWALDRNINQLNNCYSYPTFNTTSSGGGWSHWGGTGHKGSYGQNTNKQYIFNKNNIYSHWIANGTEATYNYLLYQSPAFDGGIRSIQFIIKEENNLPINENICYPAWNARNGGAVSNKWTSIDDLGDGFYLCKVESISQTGSNNLVGVYVRNGYKIYVSEGYCENNRQICSDIFNQDDLTTIYDSSGYNHNGTIIGTATLDFTSPRYDIATYMNNNNSANRIEADPIVLPIDGITVSFWAYTTKENSYVLYIDQNMSFAVNAAGTGFWVSRVNSKGFPIDSFILGQWNHVVLIRQDSDYKAYINGVEISRSMGNNVWTHSNGRLYLLNRNSNNSYAANASISDFRMYATALSAEDILELYHTGESIDKAGNLYAYEFYEDDSASISAGKNGVVTAKQFDNQENLTSFYKTGQIYTNELKEI